MSVRTKLREDFDAVAVRRLAKASKDAAQTRRLMALAAIYDGGSHLDAARIGGVTPQIIHDWVVRFNARGAKGLISGHAGGSASKLTDDHRRALAKMVEDGAHHKTWAAGAGGGFGGGGQSKEGFRHEFRIERNGRSFRGSNRPVTQLHNQRFAGIIGDDFRNEAAWSRSIAFAIPSDPGSGPWPPQTNTSRRPRPLHV